MNPFRTFIRALREKSSMGFYRPILIALIASTAFIFTFGILTGCAESVDAESITLSDEFNGELSLGDTTEALLAVKKARNAQGRLNTDSKYPQIELVSDDESIVKVISSRRLLGVAAGETYITVRDRNSALTSPRYRVTVE
jgi:hypothetical protein